MIDKDELSKLNKLTEQDVINLALYGIYRMSENPEYSTMSELIYTLDKDNFYKLISEFGGTTVKIPTIEELQIALKAMILYRDVRAGSSFVDAFNKLDIRKEDRASVINMYDFFDKVLENYE